MVEDAFLSAGSGVKTSASDTDISAGGHDPLHRFWLSHDIEVVGLQRDSAVDMGDVDSWVCTRTSIGKRAVIVGTCHRDGVRERGFGFVAAVESVATDAVVTVAGRAAVEAVARCWWNP